MISHDPTVTDATVNPNLHPAPSYGVRALVARLAISHEGVVGRAPILQDVTQSFAIAHKRLYRIGQERGLQEVLEAEGIDNTDPDDQVRYWGAVAAYVEEDVQRKRQARGDSLQLRTEELLALTPAYLYVTRSIQEEYANKRQPSDDLLAAASNFGRLMREFADIYQPAIHDPGLLSTVEKGMHGMVELMGLEEGPEKYDLDRIVGYGLRGARYERAFGRVLKALEKLVPGIRSEESDSGSDWRKGEKYDYKLWTPDSDDPVLIDCKSSPWGVRNRPEDQTYTIDPRNDRKIILWSLLTDKDFEPDSFTVFPGNAAVKARLLLEMLKTAFRDSW